MNGQPIISERGLCVKKRQCVSIALSGLLPIKVVPQIFSVLEFIKGSFFILEAIMKELLMGNEAVALGALLSGVQVVSGYPGTPSTEVIETIAKRNPGNVHVEWSVNEKAAMEVAAGAAYSGARALVTMKQVGLNVASDPLMCVNYIGVKGGLVVYVADDPGPISSQTEQDTRHFAGYAKIPVLDCSSPEEAFCMINDAFLLSERLHNPVILRSTTRVCHSCASIEVPEIKAPGNADGFKKDSRWVIFPRLSYQNKMRLEAQEVSLSEEFSEYERNEIIGAGKIGIACGGVSYQYVMDAISGNEKYFTVFKVATPYPFPETLAEKFLKRKDKVIVFEELDSVIEDALVLACGRRGIKNKIVGKRTASVPNAGELSALIVAGVIENEAGIVCNIFPQKYKGLPSVPGRPPVLCAGCPHRASFYDIKMAMKGKSAVYCGDIGCYTLGNAAPLDMVDTCLCMGAGITIAQGINHACKDTVNFAFVGDSTFFAAGITGVINAVYNKADMVLVVLDNSTTAMTGHQPHPGMGVTVMNEITAKVSIEAVLKGISLTDVITLNPLEHKKSVEAVKEIASKSGVRAIIFKSPCVAIIKPEKSKKVNSAECVGCKRCINELGCPALSFESGKALIDNTLCTGCGLCSEICPKKCIGEEA